MRVADIWYPDHCTGSFGSSGYRQPPLPRQAHLIQDDPDKIVVRLIEVARRKTADGRIFTTESMRSLTFRQGTTGLVIKHWSKPKKLKKVRAKAQVRNVTPLVAKGILDNFFKHDLPRDCEVRMSLPDAHRMIEEALVDRFGNLREAYWPILRDFPGLYRDPVVGQAPVLDLRVADIHELIRKNFGGKRNNSRHLRRIVTEAAQKPLPIGYDRLVLLKHLMDLPKDLALIEEVCKMPFYRDVNYYFGPWDWVALLRDHSNSRFLRVMQDYSRNGCADLVSVASDTAHVARQLEELPDFSGARSVRELHDIADHALRVQMRREVPLLPIGDERTSFLRGRLLLGKYEIVPPTTNHEMLDWGDELDHCIGSYWYDARHGRAYYLAVKEISTGRLIGTAEISRGRVSQWYGKHNARIQDSELSTDFFAALYSGGILNDEGMNNAIARWVPSER